MTVSTTVSENAYDGNGATTLFNFTFPTLEASNITVELISSSGVITPQAQGTDYTVQNAGFESGGSVTMTVAPPSGTRVRIRRILPYTQPTDYKNQGSFYPATHERSFDRLTMLVQQLRDNAGMVLTPGPGGSLVYDAQGNSIVNSAAAQGPNDLTTLSQVQTLVQGAAGGQYFAAPQYWQLAPNGVLTSFPIAGADVSDPLFYEVVVDGVRQEPGSDYSITVGSPVGASTITFSSPPPNATDAWVVLRGFAQPFGGSVGTVLTSSIITTEPEPGIPSSRQLIVTAPLQLNDGGEGSSVNLSAQQLTPSSYTIGPGQLSEIIVDRWGRVLGGASVPQVTIASVGAGSSLAAGKVGQELRVKSLVAGAGVTLTSAAETVTIAASGGGGGSGVTTIEDVAGSTGASIIDTGTGATARLRKIRAGSNVTVTQNNATGEVIVSASGTGIGTDINSLTDVDAPLESRETQPHLQWDETEGQYKAVKIPFAALAGVQPFGNFNEVYFGNAPGDVIYWNGTTFINGKATIPEDVFNGASITSDGRFAGHIHRITNAGGLSTITLTNDLAPNAYIKGGGFWTFQEGTAGVAFTAGPGVTIRSPGGTLSFNTQWQMIWVHKVSENTWAIVPLSGLGAGGGGSVDLAANYSWTGSHTWSRPGPNPSGLTIQQGTDQSKALIYGYRSGVAGNDRSGLIEYQYDNTGGNATVVNYLTLYQRGNLTGGFSATETLFAQADSLNGGAILGSYIVAQSPASAAYGGSGQAWGSGITYAQEINYANRWQDFGFQRDFALGRWVGGTLYAADCLFGPDGLSPSGVGFHATYGIVFAPGTNGGVSRGTFTPVYVARDTVPNTGVTVLLRGGTTSGGGFRPDAGVELDLNYTDGFKTTAATFTGKAIAMAVGQRVGWGSHDQTYASAVPTSGTWALGSIVWNSNQGTGEFAGWKCIQAGTPGVWEGFGGRRMRLIGVGVNATGEGIAYDRAVVANTPAAVYSGTGNHIHLGDQTGAWWNVTVSGGNFTINNLVSGGGTPRITLGAGTAEIKLDGGVGFQGTNPIAKPTVTGSRGGNAALLSLLTALANYGLITDNTTA